jgi:hypothetical protein
MPLSEHEQKVLSDLEKSLLQHDPRFAKSVGNISLYARRRRRNRLSIAGFVVGFTILVAFFTQSLLLGLLGLGIMFASCLTIANLWRFARERP